MDTFMDKLAQKLTAQEMIKANSAADAEELDRLKSQVEEYNDCLAQMKQVNNELQIQLGRLVEEGVAKLESAKVDGAKIDRLVQESIAKIREIERSTNDLQEIKQVLSEKLTESNENVHKECVKVYRNVQAVVVEENGKQTEAANSAAAGMKSMLNKVFIVSVAALVAAAGGIVFQLLVYLHII